MQKARNLGWYQQVFRAHDLLTSLSTVLWVKPVMSAVGINAAKNRISAIRCAILLLRNVPEMCMRRFKIQRRDLQICRRTRELRRLNCLFAK